MIITKKTSKRKFFMHLFSDYQISTDAKEIIFPYSHPRFICSLVYKVKLPKTKDKSKPQQWVLQSNTFRPKKKEKKTENENEVTVPLNLESLL